MMKQGSDWETTANHTLISFTGLYRNGSQRIGIKSNLKRETNVDLTKTNTSLSFWYVFVRIWTMGSATVNLDDPICCFF